MRAEAAARAAFPARRQSAAPRARRGTDGGERREEEKRGGPAALRGPGRDAARWMSE